MIICLSIDGESGCTDGQRRITDLPEPPIATHRGVELVEEFDEPADVEEGAVRVAPVGLVRDEDELVEDAARLRSELLTQLPQLRERDAGHDALYSGQGDGGGGGKERCFTGGRDKKRFLVRGRRQRLFYTGGQLRFLFWGGGNNVSVGVGAVFQGRGHSVWISYGVKKRAGRHRKTKVQIWNGNLCSDCSCFL